MFLFDFFRSFLPLHNPIGFGAVDFIELALAALLLLLVLARARLEPAAGRLASHTAWCMLLLAALPIALRLALLHHHPVPTPAGSDDFSYFLLADTLRHFRLANPTHPFYRFFEAIFVLQQPTYSSIFPPGQGIVMALGWMLFGHPWAGVVLSVGALCALCYWMLRGWTSPGWALLGGLLAVTQFGPLNQWMNSYWGGAVSGCGGCLVFGALPRLRETGRTRDAVWQSLGRYDLRPRLRSTFPPGTAPRTLVVQGTDDPLPIAASQELAGLLAARVVTLETGHAPHVEATADFVRTLDAFLPRS
jgi:pimeloyl-ACP methyl ester carboxylesterase